MAIQPKKCRHAIRFRRGRYPWIAWFFSREKKLTIRQGTDFDVEPRVMAQTIRNMAPSYGIKKVSVRTRGKTLEVTFA